MNILYNILLSVACAYLYWVGGKGKETVPWANTKVRDWGCPTMIVAGFSLFEWHSSLILVWFLLWAALTVGDFGKFQWSIHGFCVGLAVGPYAYYTGHIFEWLVCIVLITWITYAWSVIFSNDKIEEGGRGFIYGLMPIIMNVIIK